MPRKKNIGPLTGEAEALEEAADKKLAAAKKIAQANAILKEEDEGSEESPEEAPPTLGASFIPYEPPMEEQEPPSRIDTIVSQMRGQGKFSVFKMVGSAKSKLGVFPIEDYPDQLEVLAQEHGGGTFRVVFTDERGLFKGQDTTTFDPSAYRKSRVDDSNSSMERLMERMDRKEAAFAQALEASRAENMRLMLTMVEKLSAPRQETSIIEAIKVVREMEGERRGPLDQVKEIMELAALVKEETGASEPEHPMVAAIDKVFKVISPFIGAWAQKAANAPPSSVGPLPVPQPPGSTGASGPVPHAPMIQSDAKPAVAEPAATPVTVDPRIKQYADSLLSQAESKALPESIGDAVINLTPEENLGELYDMMCDPGFVGTLIAAEPKLTAHQAWLASLVSYVKTELDTASAEVEAENAASAAVATPVTPLPSTPTPEVVA